jgi:hypothetical protein
MKGVYGENTESICGTPPIGVGEKLPASPAAIQPFVNFDHSAVYAVTPFRSPRQTISDVWWKSTVVTW